MKLKIGDIIQINGRSEFEGMHTSDYFIVINMRDKYEKEAYKLAKCMENGRISSSYRITQYVDELDPVIMASAPKDESKCWIKKIKKIDLNPDSSYSKTLKIEMTVPRIRRMIRNEYRRMIIEGTLREEPLMDGGLSQVVMGLIAFITTYAITSDASNKKMKEE